MKRKSLSHQKESWNEPLLQSQIGWREHHFSRLKKRRWTNKGRGIDIVCRIQIDLETKIDHATEKDHATKVGHGTELDCGTKTGQGTDKDHGTKIICWDDDDCKTEGIVRMERIEGPKLST